MIVFNDRKYSKGQMDTLREAFKLLLFTSIINNTGVSIFEVFLSFCFPLSLSLSPTSFG